uniref:Uncharacterized protein n=1 Tax=Arundo donax TaxID=35708 RepID=A0A0A8Z5J7_ARUDO
MKYSSSEHLPNIRLLHLITANKSAILMFALVKSQPPLPGALYKYLADGWILLCCQFHLICSQLINFLSSALYFSL